MLYATQQDLIDRFGERELIELTDRANPPAGTIDTDVIDSAIADAGEKIDSYIGTRYELPLASVPAGLKRAASDLARYYLYEDRPTAVVEKAYEDTIAFLKDISAGRAMLDVGGQVADQIGEVQHNGPGRIFTNDTLKDFG